MPGTRPRPALPAVLLALAVAGCGGSHARSTCGLASLAGANLLLGAFATPNVTLSAPPRRVPATLAVRVVAGPLYSASVTRSDSTLRVTLQGEPSSKLVPGSGVLIQDSTGRTRGVLLFDAPPVAGAPQIGTVVAGEHLAPLVGIMADPTLYQDPRCPLFPDSAAS